MRLTRNSNSNHKHYVTVDKAELKPAFFPPDSRQHFNPAEKADMMDETNWGSSFEWKEIEYMAKYFDVYDVKDHFVLLREGQKIIPYMGLIISGRVVIVKEDMAGKRKELAHIPKGKTFGEMSLIDGMPSSASVITESDVRLMVMNKPDFEKLLIDNPQISNKLLFKLLSMLSSRLRETSGKLVDFLDRVEG